MRKPRNFAGWQAGIACLAGIGLALAHQRRSANAAERLRGKVALITGGSRGLGFAIANELSSHGVRLILTARDQAELERARDLLVQSGNIAAEDVFVQRADVSQPQEVRSLVEAGTNHFGQIDVLVNNAGVIMVGGAENQTLDSFHQAMNANFYGALHCTLALLPQMLARREGAIVNIASIGGKVAFPHLLPYVASKFALTGWSQGLRAELAAKGIRVTTVTPGIMRTGSHIQARYTGQTEKEYRWFAAAASSPLTATDAASAARKIVRALANHSAEIAIGLQAIAAGRLAGVAPEVTAIFLETANRVLPAPRPSGDFWGPDKSVSGKVHQGSLPWILEKFGDAAIERYNQS